MIALVAAAAFGAVVGAFLVWLHWRLMHAHLRVMEYGADLDVRVQSLTSDLATYESHLRRTVDRHRAEHRPTCHLDYACTHQRILTRLEYAIFI